MDFIYTYNLQLDLTKFVAKSNAHLATKVSFLPTNYRWNIETHFAPKECCNVAMQFLWSILMKLQRISCKAKMIESILLRTSQKCPQTPQWKFSILLLDVFPLKKIITLSKTTHVDHRPSALVLTKQLV